MSEVIWSPAEWARAEFGGCDLGDRRRVQRAVKYAEQAVADPDGSTPEQTESWGDCKAAYRLFDCAGCHVLATGSAALAADAGRGPRRGVVDRRHHGD